MVFAPADGDPDHRFLRDIVRGGFSCRFFLCRFPRGFFISSFSGGLFLGCLPSSFLFCCFFRGLLCCDPRGVYDGDMDHIALNLTCGDGDVGLSLSTWSNLPGNAPSATAANVTTESSEE